MNYLKARLEMALRKAEILGVRAAMGDIKADEVEKCIQWEIVDLYKAIAGLEPKHESEVV